jgi:molecular chaperone DnaK
MADLRAVLKSDDGEVIAKKTEALATAAAGIAQQAYAAGQGESGAAGGASATPGAEGPAPGGKDNVVDAEFEEVKDQDSGKDQRAS